MARTPSKAAIVLAMSDDALRSMSWRKKLGRNPLSAGSTRQVLNGVQDSFANCVGRGDGVRALSRWCGGGMRRPTALEGMPKPTYRVATARRRSASHAWAASVSGRLCWRVDVRPLRAATTSCRNIARSRSPNVQGGHNVRRCCAAVWPCLLGGPGGLSRTCTTRSMQRGRCAGNTSFARQRLYTVSAARRVGPST